MANPYFSMLGTSWRYCREKKKFVMLYGMFVVANAIAMTTPFFIGWLLDKLQHNTRGILRYALIYIGCYIGVKFLFWCIHGPARVMERTMAFRIGRNFLQERYH